MNLPELANLFRRDFRKLAQQIEAFPGDELLWQTLPGITNSAGNLTLHLEGNLREYVGRILGDVPYTRTRDVEFSSRGLTKADLLARLESLQQTIPAVLDRLPAERLLLDWPIPVLERPVSTEVFLIHLYGHFNMHLGQIEYLRRALTGNGVLPRVAL